MRENMVKEVVDSFKISNNEIKNCKINYNYWIYSLECVDCFAFQKLKLLENNIHNENIP